MMRRGSGTPNGANMEAEDIDQGVRIEVDQKVLRKLCEVTIHGMARGQAKVCRNNARKKADLAALCLAIGILWPKILTYLMGQMSCHFLDTALLRVKGDVSIVDCPLLFSPSEWTLAPDPANRAQHLSVKAWNQPLYCNVSTWDPVDYLLVYASSGESC